MIAPRWVLGQAGGGRGGPADPLVLPGLVELLVVAPGLVDRGQLPGDLLPVRPASARHLVGADVDLPLGPCALNPAVRARMLEREPLGRQVVGVAHIDDRVLVRLGVRLGLVCDRIHRGAGRWRPAGQQPGSLAWVPSQRAEPDHPAASSSSLTASVRTTGAGRRRAFLTARQNSSVAFSIASSRLSASTISWAPYRFVPIPVAMPSVAATASAS